jgi:hypothetical protein
MFVPAQSAPNCTSPAYASLQQLRPNNAAAAAPAAGIARPAAAGEVDQRSAMNVEQHRTAQLLYLCCCN